MKEGRGKARREPARPGPLRGRSGPPPLFPLPFFPSFLSSFLLSACSSSCPRTNITLPPPPAPPPCTNRFFLLFCLLLGLLLLRFLRLPTDYITFVPSSVQRPAPSSCSPALPSSHRFIVLFLLHYTLTSPPSSPAPLRSSLRLLSLRLAISSPLPSNFPLSFIPTIYPAAHTLRRQAQTFPP